MPTRNVEEVQITEAVGRTVREWRAANEGVLREDIADAARRVGLDWGPSSVADLEAGRRRLTLQEFLLLPFVLREASGGAEVPSPAGLLQVGKGELLALSPVVTLTPEQARQHAESDPALDLADVLYRAADGPAKREAERKAARKFNVDIVDIGVASYTLWGKSLTEERDARLAAAGSSGRAAAGHVSRQLLAELGEIIEDVAKGKN